jgi:hypothetical protein
MLRGTVVQFDKLGKIFMYAAFHGIPNTDVLAKARVLGFPKKEFINF